MSPIYQHFPQKTNYPVGKEHKYFLFESNLYYNTRTGLNKCFYSVTQGGQNSSLIWQYLLKTMLYNTIILA